MSGLSWMDREWSTSALGPDLAGWDWFALQLDDGRELMVYRLRRRDGTADAYSAGALVDGRRRARGRCAPGDVSLEALGDWTSPRSGVRYPRPLAAAHPRGGPPRSRSPRGWPTRS